MTNQTEPVLVIGATGQQGGAAAHELLDRGQTVHALVRDADTSAARLLHEAGARLVRGDLDDPESLRAAMSDVRGVFLVLTMMSGAKISPEGVATEIRRGKVVAEIAKETGVAHLVYGSIGAADLNTGIPHLESKRRIEEHVLALELPATVLRPAFFMENFTSLSPPVVNQGEVIVPLALRPETRLPMISTQDIGVFAAMAFDAPERFVGQQIGLAGDDLTGPAIAQAFGRAGGLPARFQKVPIEQLRAIDEEVARMFEWFDNRSADIADIAALRAIHPDLMTLPAWLRKTAWEPRTRPTQAP